MFFQRKGVHAWRTFQATILTKWLENVKNSSMVGAVAMPTGSKVLRHAGRLVTPVFFQRKRVHAGRPFQATILTKWLENVKNSPMVGALAMPTGSKFSACQTHFPHARRLVTPAFFQGTRVNATANFDASILTGNVADPSSMVDVAVMRTTLKLRGHAIKNVANRKKGKNCLKDNMAELFSLRLQQNAGVLKTD